MDTLADQSKEVQRELALRTRLYPSFIARGTLTEGQAAWSMGALQAVLATLQRLEEAQTQPSLFRLDTLP